MEQWGDMDSDDEDIFIYGADESLSDESIEGDEGARGLDDQLLAAGSVREMQDIYDRATRTSDQYRSAI
jgi:hypothetical protein